VAGAIIKFFKLSFVYKDTTILVPIHNTQQVALRYLSTEHEITDALKVLDQPPEKKIENLDFTPSGWNKRNKMYRQKIQDGTLVDLAQVYRDLMWVGKHKELSFGEKSLLHAAEDLIMQEVMVIRSCEKDEILHQLRSPFSNYSHFQDDSRQISSLTG